MPHNDNFRIPMEVSFHDEITRFNQNTSCMSKMFTWYDELADHFAGRKWQFRSREIVFDQECLDKCRRDEVTWRVRVSAPAMYEHDLRNSAIYHLVTTSHFSQQFGPNEGLLCDLIPFFKSDFSGGFEETNERTIDSPEDDPKTFGSLVCWLLAIRCASQMCDTSRRI